MPSESDLMFSLTCREQLYHLLGRIYQTEIDGPLLEQMKAMSFPGDCCEPELAEGYRCLQGYLDLCGINPLTALAADYARVFLGAGAGKGSSAAYPYESVYTSPKRIMMQEARDLMAAIYTARGLGKDDITAGLAEDHLALQLEFMAVLCLEAKNALAAQNHDAFAATLQEQSDFLDRHLLNWVPLFCADIGRHAESAFYQGIGKITNGFVRLDRAVLGGLHHEL